MKKLLTIKGKLSFLSLIASFLLLLLFSALSCTNEQIEDEILEGIKDDSEIKAFVPIQNPGFESGKVNWGSTSNYAISSDEHSGSKAGKVKNSSGKVAQTVSVSQNTDYTLKAWVKGNGKLSIGGKANDFNASSFEEVSVSFNSGGSSSVTILGTRDSGDVRFDDFTLESVGVSSSENLALGKATQQSSTAYNGVSSRAVDGNTSGNWNQGSITHTANSYRPWWQVRLGTEHTINQIVIWNRTNCCSNRLSNFDVFVYNDAGQSVFKTTIVDYPTPSVTINTGGVVGSRVRVKLKGTNPLSLAEVQVFGEGSGNPGDTTPPGAVSNLSANAGDGSVSLSWNNPNDSDFNNVSITYAGGSTTATGENKTISGLTNGTSYTFTVVAKDDSGNTSSSKSITATPQGNTGGGNDPSDILSGLDKWKITFPLDEDGHDSTNDSKTGDDCGDRNRNADEMRDITGSIPSPYSDYFYVEGDEVVFKAHCGGATTSGSSYPRSELRQTPGGNDNYWSMDDYQYLDVRVRATHLPVEKPEVSMVQIHGPRDEPLRVEYRADDQGLHVVMNENNTAENVLPYSLGEQLRVTVTVNNGNIRCVIVNESRPNVEPWDENWDAEDSTGYFKVGCYTQSTMFLSDCKGSGYSDESPSAYGEVRVKNMTLDVTY